MKKRMISVLMIIVLLFGLAGCEKKKDNEKIKITMYLWDKPMMKELTPWLETKFPDIEFTFVVGYNTMDFYEYLNDRGSFPDIITCRRFSLNDAAHLSDVLLDLSETDVVGSYYDSYIENNREIGGEIRWLPLCAEVDGYIANIDLFEKYQIPIPENQAEFADACKKFEDLGIRGYMNDYSMDYSCMEAMQGCSIQELISMEGIMWRTKYESDTQGNQVALDEKVWPIVFQKLEQYLKDTRVIPEDINLTVVNMIDAFLEDKTAIIRGTAEDCILFREAGVNAVMLPYYGETKENSWILTYPSFQAAVSKNVEKDEKKMDAVISVLEAMLSDEGQKHVAMGNAMLSYNKNVNFQMSEVFSQVKDCIDSNRMYMRLASTEMFSISQAVVQKMITGEYDGKTAYSAFNEMLISPRKNGESNYKMTQEKSYEYEFGKHGSPAASAVVNTLQRQSGDDITIGFGNVVTSSVFAGDYDYNQTNRLLNNMEQMFAGELTGEEVRKLMEWLINAKPDGANPVRHKNLLPVTSGMEYEVKNNKDGTYTLLKLTINGKQLEKDKKYAVSMFGDIDFIEKNMYCNCPMPEEIKYKMELQKINVYTYFRNALENGNQIAEPTEYVTIK